MAKLAGLPGSVLGRAGELLAMFEGEKLESGGQKRSRPRRAAEGQLSLFTPPGDERQNAAQRSVADRIRGVDIDRLSPLEALRLLAELKGQLAG